MILDQNPLGLLRAKGRSLRRNKDPTRIQASSTILCDGTLTSPKLAQIHISHEDLSAPHGSSRTPSVDTYSHDHEDFSTNSPVLLRGDKELHDPNYVRHNWEMMSGETTYPDNQLHIGRASSPHLTKRRSTLSSRSSSRPSSRGSESGGQHTPTFGLGVNAFSGFSSYSQAGSIGRASGSRTSSSTRGLQVEGSILRDEEAILDSDDSSSDEEGGDEYKHGSISAFSRPTSRRSSPTPRNAPSVHLTETSPRSSEPASTTLTQQQAAAPYHRRRHWTVAEGSQASIGAGLHAIPGQMSSSRTAVLNERSLSQPA